jgi:hypothetical protein
MLKIKLLQNIHKPASSAVVGKEHSNGRGVGSIPCAALKLLVIFLINVVAAGLRLAADWVGDVALHQIKRVCINMVSINMVSTNT